MLDRPNLQVYHRRQQQAPVDRSSDPPLDSPPEPSCPTTSDPAPPSSDLHLPIALRKESRTCPSVYRQSTTHPISNFVSYDSLSPSYKCFITSLSSVSIPKTIAEALSHYGWRSAMLEEMSALNTNKTWELVPLPSGKSTVGCRWIFTVKVSPDGKVDRLKARLVAKGYTQIYSLDYCDTFSPVAKVTSIRLFLSLAALFHWPLHQLDIKNAFLHGDLQEEVYMEQPPGFVAQGGMSGMVCRLKKALYGLKQSPRVWFGRFSAVVVDFGLAQSSTNHSLFYRITESGRRILLLVYVDDIVITGDDMDGIALLKSHLHRQFHTKDLGPLKYFLGIEVARSKQGIYISQRKYVLDMLEETGMLGCKHVDTPMDPNVKLLPNQGELFSDVRRYRRLVGKLNYLTVTRPDISFAVSVVSQFLNSPCEGHWEAVVRILRYLKRAPGKGLL